LVLEPDRVAPGGTLLARGDDFGADADVTIELVVGGGRITLATTASDGEGHFAQSVRIPQEAAGGAYRLEATGSSGIVLAADLAVEALPGGGPVRDPDDRQIGAAPALPASESDRRVITPPASAPLTVPQAGTDPAPILLVGGGAVAIVGLLGVLLVDRLRSRRGA
jgi:hypothetical protein